MKTHAEFIQEIQHLLEADYRARVPLRQFVANWVDDEQGPRSIAVLAHTEVEARQIIEDVTGAVSLRIVSH